MDTTDTIRVHGFKKIMETNHIVFSYSLNFDKIINDCLILIQLGFPFS